MKEFILSILETSKSRLKDPFIGAFLMALLIYNWRPLLILMFSAHSIETKILQVDLAYCTIGALLWPLLIALIYVLLLPHINYQFDRIITPANSKREAIKNENLIVALIHKKSEAKIEREIAEERAGTSEINDLKSQIEKLESEKFKISEFHKNETERLNDSLNLLDSRFNELNKKYNSLIKDYDELKSKNEINNNLNNLDYYRMSSSEKANVLNEILFLLSAEEKKYYYLFCSSLNDKDNLSTVYYDESKINLFAKLGLFVLINNRVAGITTLGESVLQAIKKIDNF